MRNPAAFGSPVSASCSSLRLSRRTRFYSCQPARCPKTPTAVSQVPHPSRLLHPSVWWLSWFVPMWPSSFPAARKQDARENLQGMRSRKKNEDLLPGAGSREGRREPASSWRPESWRGVSRSPRRGVARPATPHSARGAGCAWTPCPGAGRESSAAIFLSR